MKQIKALHLCILLLLVGMQTAVEGQIPALAPVRGMYVNQFHKILGNTAKEDSLLNYARTKKINYFTFYNLHQDIIGNSAKEDQLSDFITRAKLTAGVLEVGAALESPVMAGPVSSGNSVPLLCLPNALPNGLLDSTLLGDVSGLFCFNQLHTGKIDRINIEHEYWLAPDDKRDSVFDVYINTLKAVRKIAGQALPALKIEAYLGWPTLAEVQRIDPLLDRVLIHAYRKTPNDTYAYTRTRLSYFADDRKTTHFLPIFNTEQDFMHNWTQDNSLAGAEKIYRDDFSKETESWKQYLQLDGYQWFTYTDMPQNAKTESAASTGSLQSTISAATLEATARPFPNPAKDAIIIPYPSEQTSGALDIHLYDLNGKLLVGYIMADGSDLKIDLGAYPSGLYFLRMSDERGRNIIAKFTVAD